MLGFLICAAGVVALSLASEWLWSNKIFSGEGQRKFFHISVGVFGSFWPWITSWQYIRLLVVLLLAAAVFNRRKTIFNFGFSVRRNTYGEIYILPAVIICSFMTHNKIFFAVAMLHVALADGFAALSGVKYGKAHRYKIFGHEKTLVGTLTFWLFSLCILGIGLLFAGETISKAQYWTLVIFLPPVLAALENLTIKGLDNLVIPIAVVSALISI